MNKVNHPSECGLAMALPLNYDAFCKDLSSGYSMDYAYGMTADRDADDAWKKIGAPVANLCSELANDADRLGVRVCPAATLPELGSLFSERSIVTIVAHWKGPRFSTRDLLVDPKLFIDRIRDSCDELSIEIAAHLPPNNNICEGISLEGRQSSLADMLNRALIESPTFLSHRFLEKRSSITAIDDLELMSERRRQLDHGYPEIFRPGNRLEMRDGLHAVESIMNVIPSDWKGTIDLALCHSAYAAHLVKDARPERNIIMSSRAVIPEIRLRVQKQLYICLSQKRGSYATLLTALLRFLKEQLPR
jgi:hypothetical protein